jgi:hypothetical protein
MLTLTHYNGQSQVAQLFSVNWTMLGVDWNSSEEIKTGVIVLLKLANQHSCFIPSLITEIAN